MIRRESGEIRLEGWLKKKGEGVGSLFYKKRYFRKEKKYLFYFKREEDGIELNLGHIPLEEISSVHPTLKSDPFAFQVNTRHRTWYLCAENAVEMDYWVIGLVKYIKLTGTEERLDKEMVANDPEKFISFSKPESFQHVGAWDGNKKEVVPIEPNAAMEHPDMIIGKQPEILVPTRRAPPPPQEEVPSRPPQKLNSPVQTPMPSIVPPRPPPSPTRSSLSNKPLPKPPGSGTTKPLPKPPS